MGKSHRRDVNRWNDDSYDFDDTDRKKVKDNINRRKLKRMKNALRGKDWQTVADYDDERY